MASWRASGAYVSQSLRSSLPTGALTLRVIYPDIHCCAPSSNLTKSIPGVLQRLKSVAFKDSTSDLTPICRRLWLNKLSSSVEITSSTQSGYTGSVAHIDNVRGQRDDGFDYLKIVLCPMASEPIMGLEDFNR